MGSTMQEVLEEPLLPFLCAVGLSFHLIFFADQKHGKPQNAFVPGVEKDRLPAKWIPMMVASSILNGSWCAISAFTLLEGNFTGVLSLLITFTAINYWRQPEPGLRHTFDLIAIVLNCIWHYYLALTNTCATLAMAYIAPHWILMAASLLAYNHLPQSSEGWGNRDWSAALWICVHISVSVMNTILYQELTGTTIFC
jgi:hypothetical protein